MGASGGQILQDFYDEIQKVADRHEHALGYAPGMDQLEADDWSELNEFLKTMRKTYTRLTQKYHWQIGLNAEELSQISHECYKESERTDAGFDFYVCKKQKADEFKVMKRAKEYDSQRNPREHHHDDL